MRKIAALVALIAAMSVPAATAIAHPAHDERVQALKQRVHGLRQENSDLQDRLQIVAGAWWRLDLAIVFLRDSVGMDLPQEVLDARQRSWEDAQSALPHL
jgi:hypothetical protein